ncbi:sodium-dependent transporter [Micrococcus sp.]|uniref:sodium-dependent transporter n=1 Tax=Micrococcus sp. TaxID=1271 RepID=UPI002A917A98|nr:sodium-dependent transporter [Micrococcus sp.]MDY6055291.1 sodium-dependent transporter [Micrococcus sp.]
MSSTVTAEASTPRRSREEFTGRWAFILAAIGSAVGLGNIWRFPYVAYENGGGAFVIPYLVALLTAGIPLLFFDYAIGHRFRGSAPMAFRRMSRWTEAIGWWQVLICTVIAIYYAAIIGWAISYTGFSLDQRWGSDPEAFLGQYLQTASDPTPSFDIVPGVFWPMLVVWVVTLLIMGFGVRRGVALASMVGIPLLVVMFLVLVVIALTLPGAVQGLDALFTPNWAALTEPGVWIAAYGQIFFSLSVGFGIMITYASYLKKRTNLTGSGLVVGFSNSGFEILAGIGVFSALGFMAQASGVSVAEVAGSGIGLAFIAFPTLISQAPLGALIGILFFGSLVLAGFTSLISILEVVVSAVKDKLGWGRWTTTGVVVGLSAVVSLFLFGTTTGLPMLDTVDAFANNFGIVGAAMVAVIAVFWLARKGRVLVEHLNAVSSFRLGRGYMVLAGLLMPLVLAYMWSHWVIAIITNGYGEYPASFLNVYGWGLALGMVVLAVLLSLIPWSHKSSLHSEENLHEMDHSAPTRAERTVPAEEA